jgi:hypothetical protein
MMALGRPTTLEPRNVVHPDRHIGAADARMRRQALPVREPGPT